MPDTLVILSPAFPENESATNWVPSQQIFVKAVKRNFPELNLIVLSFQYPLTRSSYLWHGIRVESFGGMHMRKFQRVLLWRRIWNELNRIRKHHKVLGIFSFWCGECALLGKYFGRRYGITHFCWLCGQDAKKENRLVRWIRPKPKELIAMSPFLQAEFHKNHGVRPALVVSNGIDYRMFPEQPSQRRDVDIFAAGSLSPIKQYEILVSLVKRLKEKLPGILALHCGGGSEWKKLNALIASARIGDQLLLLGEKQHTEVLGWMQRTKVFLHPSSYEGYGVVCLEALHAGAQVISFCDPTGKKIAHWHIVKDEEQMYEKALELLRDPDLDCCPVPVQSMDDSAKAILRLFYPVPDSGSPGTS
jgi:glycosyltransferase involved in cell wall biosynthesis